MPSETFSPPEGLSCALCEDNMRLKIKDSLHQAIDGLAKEHVAQLSRLIEGTTSFPNSTDFKDAI